MADAKISELTELATAADNDLIAIVDTSALVRIVATKLSITCHLYNIAINRKMT